MDSVSLSDVSDSVTPRVGRQLVLAASLVPFSAFILFAAARMPMSYDDAFNATLPLNLLRGNGYSSQFGGIDPFNPSISSGAAFLAPAALPMALFGTDMQWPMLYTAALCLVLYLCFLRSLHGHSPQAALATAVLVPFMLWQGKNDMMVAGNILPAAPFGYWYQLLGNLPGLLALALAMSLLLKPAPATARRWIAIVALIAFAVNAKLMHVIPLIAMLVTWTALPVAGDSMAPRAMPRLSRFAIVVGLLAAGGCGLWFNRGLAWVFLDGEAFKTFVARENTFLNDRNGAAALVSIPRLGLPGLLAKLTMDAPRASEFLGGSLQFAAILVGPIATAVAALQQARQRSVARLGLVFFVGTAAHFTWWMRHGGPPRQLTPVPALACFAMGCGFGLWWVSVRRSSAGAYRWRRLVWSAALTLLCIAGVPGLLAAFGAWGELREYRNQQVNAAAVLTRLAAKYPDAVFCAPGWWVPRDLTYLAPADTKFCNLDALTDNTPGRHILMLSSNLWPMERDDVRAASERCAAPLEQAGRFEFRGCDGFRP